MVGKYNRDTSSVTATPSTVTSSSAAFGRWAFGIGQLRRERRGRTGMVKGRSVRSGGNVLTTLSCSASGIFPICCNLTRPTITRLARPFHSTRTRRRREPYIPLVAFCLRHFLADFIICMCEFDFRQAQLKLGFEIAQSSVAKYMVKRRAPPSRLNVAVQENGRSPRYDVRRRRSPSSRAD